MPVQGRIRSGRSRAERRAALLAGYRPLPGVFDEFIDENGEVRPHWEPFLSAWCALSPAELTQRFGLADRHVRDTGVSYRVHGDIDERDPGVGERAWPLSHVPLVIPEAEWQVIAAGVTQRAELLSTVLDDIYGQGELIAEGHLPAAVVTGPSFAREVVAGLPTAVTVHSDDVAFAQRVARLLHGPTFRAYTGTDMLGAELGGAMKNVLAVATGVADGMQLGLNARAGLITRGLNEMLRLGVAIGARPETLMGLAGLGDLVLTCTGDLSRNRRLGLALGRGVPLRQAVADIGQVVESVQTADEVMRLAQRHGIELPIAEGVQRVLHQEITPAEGLQRLLAREQKPEYPEDFRG